MPPELTDVPPAHRRRVQIVNERRVVALQIVHAAPHARVAFAKAQVIGGVCFGRFAGGPVPAAAVLEVDDEDRVVLQNLPSALQPQIVHATDALLEHLWAHDRRADRQHHAADRDSPTEPPKSLKSHSAARPMAEPLNTGWLEMMS